MIRRWMSTWPLVLVVSFALVVAACTEENNPDATAGDDAGDAGDDGDDRPLEGESITWEVGFSPGGGYDSYSRMLAPYLEEELGAADVTVENVEGAGGLLSLNQVFAGPPDGTRLTIVNGAGVLGSVLSGAEGIEFELDEFQWIGRIAGEPRLMTINADLPYESIDDLVGFDGDFSFAATGVGGGAYNTAALMIEALEMENARIVAGFDGSEEGNVAVTAGEVDANTNTEGTAMGNVEAGDHRPMVVIGEERIDEIPDVPTLNEVDLPGEEADAIAAGLIANTEAGRLLALPAATEQQYVDEYRRAFEALVENEELLEEAEQKDLPLAWRDHEQVMDIINNALDAPPVVGEILEEDD